MKRKLNGRLVLSIAIMTLLLLCCAAASAGGTLHIPEGTTRIESQAFIGVKPTYVEFPAGITYIASDAFGSYKSFTGIGPTGTYAETWCKNKNIPYATPKYHALLIGNYDYVYQNDLRGVYYDLQAMQNTLKTLPQNWDITVFRNQTASGILNAIKSTFSGTNSYDVFLFYYSGHGDNSTGYSAGSLVGYNCSGYDDLVYPSQLASYLNTYCPGRVLVLLDSCGSGSYVYPNGEEPEDASPKNFTQAVTSAFSAYNSDDTNLPNTGELLNGSKFTVLAACAHGQTSSGAYLDIEDGEVWFYYGSVFTYGLVRSLGCAYPSGNYSGYMPADANGDSKLTLAEAYYGIHYYKVYMDNLYAPYADYPGEPWSEQIVQMAGASNSVIFSR